MKCYVSNQILNRADTVTNCSNNKILNVYYIKKTINVSCILQTIILTCEVVWKSILWKTNYINSFHFCIFFLYNMAFLILNFFFIFNTNNSLNDNTNISQFMIYQESLEINLDNNIPIWMLIWKISFYIYLKVDKKHLSKDISLIL